MTTASGVFLPNRYAMLLATAACLTLPALAAAQASKPVIITVRLAGSIDASALHSVESALNDARSAGAAAVVIDLDLRGGTLASAQLAVGAILESSVPVYAFVRGTAWGPGVLLALATDSTFMGAGSSMGWGTVTEDEADLSPRASRELRSELRVLALRRGLDDQIAMAMVDPDIVVEGLVGAGELLTLSAAEAIRLGYAVGQVRDVGQLLDKIGLDEEEILTATPPQLALGVRISVSNRNWRDVHIMMEYGATGSIRRTLGHVTSMNTAEFEIPQQLVMAGSRIRVLANVIGSSEQTQTDQITAQPGLAIDWVIANVISQSNYFAYIRN